MNPLTLEWVEKAEGDLMALCMKIDPSYQMVQSDLNILEGYAVQFRYPGQSADQLEAKSALKAAKVVRAFFRNRLGLP
jgi:hypothetical protein